MSQIGENIARRRKELSMTQEELAKLMGYKSKSTINKIELGINDIVQSKVVKFAQVLQTTPANLMGWVEEEKKNDIQADIILRMRSDSDFMSAVNSLYKLDKEQLQSINQMLHTLFK